MNYDNEEILKENNYNLINSHSLVELKAQEDLLVNQHGEIDKYDPVLISIQDACLYIGKFLELQENDYFIADMKINYKNVLSKNYVNIKIIKEDKNIYIETFKRSCYRLIEKYNINISGKMINEAALEYFFKHYKDEIQIENNANVTNEEKELDKKPEGSSKNIFKINNETAEEDLGIIERNVRKNIEEFQNKPGEFIKKHTTNIFVAIIVFIIYIFKTLYRIIFNAILEIIDAISKFSHRKKSSQ